MIRSSQHFSHSRGFTLIEAMIAMVILAVGLLAVAKFQSGLVANSGNNKARAEAIALAQNQIDQMRSYYDEIELLKNLEPPTSFDASSNFPDSLTDGTYNNTDASGNAEVISGTNAEFTVAWTVTKQNEAADVLVKVSWDDPVSGNNENVQLVTTIQFGDPRLTALAALDDEKVIYDVRGRARQGSGHYGTMPADATDNDDGTSTYENLSTGEVELIDQATGDVLLTLEEACNTTDGGTVCTDFVKIRGLVWIDDGRITGQDPDLNNIFVLASDASYCALKKSAVVDTGDYRYFPYTCYLGGGWSGNIGLLQLGGTSNVHDVCVGDPGSSINPPRVAQRRVYRGMISNDEYTGAGTGTAGADLYADDYDSDGVKNYGTIGIADGLALPNPYNTAINTDYNAGYVGPFSATYLPGHNFMITKLSNDPDDTECITPINDTEVNLTLTDASGNTKTVNAFDNTPYDFLCMNQVHSYAETDASGNAITALQPYYDHEDWRIEDGYLYYTSDASGNVSRQQVQFVDQTIDASGNTAIKWASDTTYDGTTELINVSSGTFMQIGCPFDPSDPPSELDFIKGSIYYTDATTSTSSGYVINTTDDIAVGMPGNCTVTPSSANADSRIFDYSCDVYHTYDVGTSTGTGWDGDVFIVPPNNFACERPDNASSYTYSIPSDNGGNLLTADVGTQTGAAGTYDFECKYSGPLGADLVTTLELYSSDSSPIQGSTVSFLITVTNNGPQDATSVTLTGNLPSGLTYTSSTPSAGSLSSGTWSGFDLLSGNSATLLVNAMVDNANLGSELTFTVGAATSAGTDFSSVGDDLTESIIVTSSGTANLVTVKSLAGSGEINPNVGDTVTYKVKVTNLGGGNVSNVTLTDSYPAKLTLDTLASDYGTDSNGTANTYVGGLWSIATLNAEDSTTLILVGTVQSGAGSLQNDVTAASSASLSDPSTINDNLTVTITATATNEANLVTTLRLIDNAVDGTTKDTTPAVNDIVSYQLTITNNGTANADLNNVNLDLRTTSGVAGLMLKTASPYAPVASQGTYNTATGWWGLGGVTLTTGQSVTLTLYADVTGSPGDTIVVTTTTGTSNKTDPTTVGDELTSGSGTPDGTLTIAASTTTIDVTGTITYGSTTDKVTGVTAYTVNGETLGSATGTCTMPTDKSGYTCTGVVSGSPTAADTASGTPYTTGGVYLEFTYGGTITAICEYDAKLSGSTLSRGNPDTGIWINNTGATTPKDINANKTTGNPKTVCP